VNVNLHVNVNGKALATYASRESDALSGQAPSWLRGRFEQGYVHEHLHVYVRNRKTGEDTGKLIVRLIPLPRHTIPGFPLL